MKTFHGSAKAYAYILVALFFLSSLPNAANGEPLSLSSAGANPRIEFKVYLPEGEGFKLPEKVEFWKAKSGEDENGILCFMDEKGKKYYNVSSVAFQAMKSRSFDIFTNPAKKLEESQIKAFDWLDRNKTILTNGSAIWYYDFPLDYNNVVITSPWPSAFSQAAVIHAYIVAWSVTGGQDWLDKAREAAYAYEVSVDEGGLKSYFDGLSFYEEVPLSHGYSPHVLNGHLYTTAMLNLLAGITKDGRVTTLAEDGIKTAKALLPLYDQGYWTRYDLLPRLVEIPFQIAPGGNSPIHITRLTIRSPDGSKSTLDTAKGDKKGILVEDETFFEIPRLPGKIPSGYLKLPGYILEIEYSGDDDKPPTAAIFGFRENIYEFYKLKSLGARKGRHGYKAEYRLPINDLQWSYLQRYYVDWHKRTLEELWRQTGEDVFLLYAARWGNYLSKYDSDLQPSEKEESLIKEKLFYEDSDEVLDGALAEAISVLKEDELTQRNTALALLRYVYFRLSLGEDHSKDAAGIIRAGRGSCAHFSKVFAALARRAGLEARIWNLYEIPVIGGHTLTEVKIDGKWAAIDPGYGAFFTNDKKWDSRIVSMEELLENKGKNVTYWDTAERGSLKRGSAPPSKVSGLKAVFAAPSEFPKFPQENMYDPHAIFATKKYGVQGEGLKYTLNRTFDLKGQKKVFLGERSWTGKAGMWNKLIGLKSGDALVSLHELGKTSIHNVHQKYTLRNLTPGAIYRFEAGVCYASNHIVAVKAKFLKKTESIVFASGTKAGFAALPQTFAVFFKANAATHELELSAEKGYVLFNYIEFGATPFRELPKDISAETKVSKKSRFYEGYGPENSMDGVLGDDYTAAVENTFPNSFMLDLKGPVCPAYLSVVWNSEKEFGKDFDLIGMDGKREIKLLEVRGNQPHKGRINNYPINGGGQVKDVEFKVYSAEGQPRLLMLDFKIFGAKCR